MKIGRHKFFIEFHEILQYYYKEMLRSQRSVGTTGFKRQESQSELLLILKVPLLEIEHLKPVRPLTHSYRASSEMLGHSGEEFPGMSASPGPDYFISV